METAALRNGLADVSCERHLPRRGSAFSLLPWQFLCRRDPAPVRHVEIGDGADVGSTDR